MPRTKEHEKGYFPGQKYRRIKCRQDINDYLMAKTDDHFLWMVDYMLRTVKRHSKEKRALKKSYKVVKGTFITLPAGPRIFLETIQRKECTAKVSVEGICYVFIEYFTKERVTHENARGAFKQYKHRVKIAESSAARADLDKDCNAKLEKIMRETNHDNVSDFLDMVMNKLAITI